MTGRSRRELIIIGGVFFKSGHSAAALYGQFKLYIVLDLLLLPIASEFAYVKYIFVRLMMAKDWQSSRGREMQPFLSAQ